jgi:hypothetical protein
VPEITVDTAVNSIDDCVHRIIDYIEQNFTREAAALVPAK